jgi:hypothetical protein
MSKLEESLYPKGYHEPVDISNARRALGRFCLGEGHLSVPVRSDDDDMLLSRALDELEKYRNLNEVYIVFDAFKVENDGVHGVYLNEKLASDCFREPYDVSDGFYMLTYKLTK